MKATILLPTTGDRGPVLEHAVRSVLQQSEPDWELFIVGDGADEETRATAGSLAETDDRIRCFDFPKDGSRGELHRHHLLSTEARGEIVCYLTDRDLYLSNHLELLYAALQDAELSHSLQALQEADGSIRVFGAPFTHTPAATRARLAGRKKKVPIPLSMVAHRLDAYRRLPHGWRPTPPGIWTDAYMWQQFFAQEWVRTSTVHFATVVYLKRGDHPGLSSAERAEESRRFAELYLGPNGAKAYQAAVNESLFAERYRQWKRVRELERGRKPFWKRLTGK